MESDKDFIKANLGNDHVDAETNFTILTNSHVKTDINLGSLGDVSDNMNVTVDASSLDHQLKMEGLGTATTLLPSNIQDQLVLVETSKGLVLSVADGSPDGLSFGGNCIATLADENGRPIITSSLQASIFSQIQQVSVIEENQHGQVFDNETGNHVVTPNIIFTDSAPIENQQPPVYHKPEDQKKRHGGGWPKGKKRKPTPVFEPPKKPMTAYVIFALKRRQEIKACSPELQFHVITKILGQEWSNMAKEEKERFGRLADEDRERYITEMQEFQNSDTYQAFLKSKKLQGEHVQGITDSTDGLLDLEDTEGLSEMYCKVCNQYFISIHNKKEHMFGRQHLQNITSQIQKDIDSQTELQREQMLFASSLDGSTVARTDGLADFQSFQYPYPKPPTQKSSSLDLFGFVTEFMEKNGERDHEIHLLRRSKQNYEEENLAISKQIKELEAYESKLDQDLESLKAYGTSLTAQKIYLIRNPKDVMVSCYMLTGFLTQIDPDMSPNDFFNDWLNNETYATPWWRHVRDFWMNRDDPSFLVLKYEDIVEDMTSTVKTIAQHIDVHVTDPEVEKIVDHCSFDKMKQNPSTNAGWISEEKTMEPRFGGHIRRGKVGGWRDYLDLEMNEKVDAMVSKYIGDIDLQLYYG